MFRLFGCSRRMQQKSRSRIDLEADSEISDNQSEKPIIVSRPSLTCSSGCGSHSPQNGSVTRVSTLRDGQGNILSTGTISSRRTLQDDVSKFAHSELGLSKDGRSFGSEALPLQQPDNQSNCGTLRVQSLDTSNICETAFASDRRLNMLAPSFPVPASSQRLLSADPHTLSCSSDHFSISTVDKV